MIYGCVDGLQSRDIRSGHHIENLGFHKIQTVEIKASRHQYKGGVSRRLSHEAHLQEDKLKHSSPVSAVSTIGFWSFWIKEVNVEH